MEVFKYGEAETDYLKKRDKKLAAAIERIGKIERKVMPDIFCALVSSIVSQQISNKAAATVWNRLFQLSGGMTAENINGLSTESIQKCGMSMRKADYIKGIASAVARGELDLNRLTQLPDDEIIDVLTKLKGIGVWTAEMLLIFSLQRPNVLSFDDLGIKRGLCILHGHKSKSIDRITFNKYKDRYSPYCSVASLYLWAVSSE
ncbi:MAG: DNA-3-methyladenine glycosylase [Firmicutes bacterium ADurb.Bin182]|nr:MAG: DNA-3-methyladenine glycosylase [Firmicutes bacterium ADurb.Bin182]